MGSVCETRIWKCPLLHFADPVSSYTVISDKTFREFSKPYLKKTSKWYF